MTYDDLRYFRSAGVGDRRINTLCLEGCIEVAIRVGAVWLIPSSIMKPVDARNKSGQYIKNNST